jgi:hypothetical protein
LTAGIVLREEDLRHWQSRLPELAKAIAAAGLDHVTVGDHISFAGGHGVDGLIQATALLCAHPKLIRTSCRRPRTWSTLWPRSPSSGSC